MIGVQSACVKYRYDTLPHISCMGKIPCNDRYSLGSVMLHHDFFLSRRSAEIDKTSSTSSEQNWFTTSALGLSMLISMHSLHPSSVPCRFLVQHVVPTSGRTLGDEHGFHCSSEGLPTARSHLPIRLNLKITVPYRVDQRQCNPCRTSIQTDFCPQVWLRIHVAFQRPISAYVMPHESG